MLVNKLLARHISKSPQHQQQLLENSVVLTNGITLVSVDSKLLESFPWQKPGQVWKGLCLFILRGISIQVQCCCKTQIISRDRLNGGLIEILRSWHLCRCECETESFTALLATQTKCRQMKLNWHPSESERAPPAVRLTQSCGWHLADLEDQKGVAWKQKTQGQWYISHSRRGSTACKTILERYLS